MTSITAKLLALDQKLKSLDPHSYNRWLIVPSCTVIALMLVWLLGDAFGLLSVRVGEYLWSISAVFVGFSFLGVATIWRIRHSGSLKVGLLLLHFTAVLLFLTPLAFALWFITGMSEH